MPMISGNLKRRRFLGFASHLLLISCEPHHRYSQVFHMLNLVPLAKRRRSTGIAFMSVLLNNKVDSSVLNSLLRFKDSQRHSRSSAPFYTILPSIRTYEKIDVLCHYGSHLCNFYFQNINFIIFIYVIVIVIN